MLTTMTSFLILLFILITPEVIHALLALILLFINIAILLFTVDASFLALAFLIVYVGAICVLFVYITLLLHLRTYSITNKINITLLISLLFIFSILFIITNKYTIDFEDTNMIYNIYTTTDLENFANHLFGTHFVYMFFAIFLLLVAIVIAIFLAVSFLNEKKSILNLRKL